MCTMGRRYAPESSCRRRRLDGADEQSSQEVGGYGCEEIESRCARPAPLLTAPPGSEAMRPPKTTPQTFFLIQSSAAIGGVTLFKFIQVFMIGPPLIIH
jgi:hypothetical protein